MEYFRLGCTDMLGAPPLFCSLLWRSLFSMARRSHSEVACWGLSTEWFSQELNWSWKRLYVCSFPKTKLAIYFHWSSSEVHSTWSGRITRAIFILAGHGEAVGKSLCLYCLMVEARLWRLVVEIEWLNCFPSVSLWANCMYSPIRSIYIRLFEPSDCIALLLTNVLTCNTVPFALYFSPLWSIQPCVMLFKEFIYPHNLSFEPISVPFISAWDCVLKLFTEK